MKPQQDSGNDCPVCFRPRALNGLRHAHELNPEVSEPDVCPKCGEPYESKFCNPLPTNTSEPHWITEPDAAHYFHTCYPCDKCGQCKSDCPHQVKTTATAAFSPQSDSRSEDGTAAQPEPKSEIEAILDTYYNDVIEVASSDEGDEAVELAVLQYQREANTRIQALIDKAVINSAKHILMMVDGMDAVPIERYIEELESGDKE